MTDFIIVAVLAVALFAAARYVYKAKKSGAKCIGCSVGEGGCCCSHGSQETTGCSCGCGGESVKESSSCCCQEK